MEDKRCTTDILSLYVDKLYQKALDHCRQQTSLCVRDEEYSSVGQAKGHSVSSEEKYKVKLNDPVQEVIGPVRPYMSEITQKSQFKQASSHDHSSARGIHTSLCEYKVERRHHENGHDPYHRSGIPILTQWHKNQVRPCDHQQIEQFNVYNRMPVKARCEKDSSSDCCFRFNLPRENIYKQNWRNQTLYNQPASANVDKSSYKYKHTSLSESRMEQRNIPESYMRRSCPPVVRHVNGPDEEYVNKELPAKYSSTTFSDQETDLAVNRSRGYKVMKQSSMTHHSNVDITQNYTFDSVSDHGPLVTQVNTVDIAENCALDSTSVAQLSSVDIIQNHTMNSTSDYVPSVTKLSSVDIPQDHTMNSTSDHGPSVTQLSSVDITQKCILNSTSDHGPSETQLNSTDIPQNQTLNSASDHGPSAMQLSSVGVLQNCILDSTSDESPSIAELNSVDTNQNQTLESPSKYDQSIVQLDKAVLKEHHDKVSSLSCTENPEGYESDSSCRSGIVIKPGHTNQKRKRSQSQECEKGRKRLSTGGVKDKPQVRKSQKNEKGTKNKDKIRSDKRSKKKNGIVHKKGTHVQKKTDRSHDCEAKMGANAKGKGSKKGENSKFLLSGVSQKNHLKQHLVPENNVLQANDNKGTRSIKKKTCFGHKKDSHVQKKTDKSLNRKAENGVNTKENGTKKKKNSKLALPSVSENNHLKQCIVRENSILQEHENKLSADTENVCILLNANRQSSLDFLDFKDMAHQPENCNTLEDQSIFVSKKHVGGVWSAILKKH